MLVSSINTMNFCNSKLNHNKKYNQNTQVLNFKGVKGATIGGISAGVLAAMLTLNKAFENNVVMQIAITTAGALSGNKLQNNFNSDKKNNTTATFDTEI